MSFSEWSNKKKKKASSFSEWSNAKYGISEEEKTSALAPRDDEIAPVRDTSGYFQKSAHFDDGYQMWDVAKTTGASIADVGENMAKGGANWLEKIWDGLLTFGTKMNESSMMQAAQNEMMYNAISGNKESASKTLQRYTEAQDQAERATAEYVAKDIIKEGNIDFGFDKYSVLGEKSDALVQSGTELLIRSGISKIPVVGVPLAYGTTAASVIGGEAENAFREGSSYDDAVFSGMWSAAGEMGSEALFGGIKIGGKTLTDATARKIASKFSNKTLSTLAKWGFNTVGEGIEEDLSGWFSAVGQKLTYADEKTLDELYTKEDHWDNFLGGIILGGCFEGINIGKAKKHNIDYVTGLKTNERKVVDKVYKDAISEAEKNGKKLSSKEKTKIFDNVIEQAGKGYISIDTIEEVLGGKTYEEYKSVTEQEKTLTDEISQLENLPKEQITVKQSERLTEAREELKNLANKDELKSKLSDEVYGIVKNSRLVESYNEKARKSQAFKADLTQYTGKQREAVERAVNSGVLNDTNKSHALVDTLSKIEADKGIIFDYADNAKLKESGFALEGKTVNAFVDKGKGAVTLNIQSAKAWQSTVGHEIAHILESTEHYETLKSELFKIAESKGELESRRNALTELYKGIDADIDAELTADLVGDYLFNDSDFVKGLTTNKNLFKKIYDEVKYLWNVATGKEKAEIEKVKREFDKAWKEMSVNTNVETDGKVNYSVSKDSSGNELSHAVQKRFANSKAVDENGNLKVVYHGTASGEFYTFDKSKGSVDGDFGSGFYFTDSESDVESNYEDGGPDFENKVARRAEQIESEEGIDYHEAESRAREELYKGGFKHSVYLNIENPAIVGETTLFDYESFAEEYDRNDYDSDEDFESDVEYLIQDKIDEIIWDIQKNVDVNSTDGIAEVLWNAINEGGIGIEELKAKINDLYLDDSNGNLVGNEVTRQIIESLGYDGIIDNTVSTKWNMDMEEGTTHYIVFKPNQIKSIDNQNPTDNPDIRYSISADNKGNRLSKEQSEFFKDSKIVDNKGNLLICYHSSPNEFTIFDKAKIGSGNGGANFGEGFYFTPDLYLSGEYGDNTKAYYLNLKNPFEYYSTDKEYIVNMLEKSGYEYDKDFVNSFDFDELWDEDLLDNFLPKALKGQNPYSALSKMVQNAGFDGIVAGDEIVAFEPNQIKLTVNKTPTTNPDIRYSLSNNNLDKSNNLVYNDKRGEGYVATDEFRSLQAESQRMSNEDTQLYWSGNKQIDDGLRGRLSRSVKQILLESRNDGRGNDSRLLKFAAKDTQYNIYDNVDSSLFHDVFEIARKHLRNGELVDLHETETTEDHGIGYKYCKNYLSEDGLSGFSITPDGDLISVFNASGKKGFLRAIAPFVKENAKTLDCYASPKQNLQGMYEAIFGFKTASVMDYNMEYDHDNIAENHNMPQVAFMVNTNSDVETRHFTEIQYDEAVAYRNGFVMSENIAPVQKSLSNKGEQPSSVGTPLQDLYLAPTREDIAKMEGATVETEDIAPMPTDAKPKSTKLADGTRGDELLYESLDNYPMETVEQRTAEKIRAIEGELADNRDLRKEAEENYNQQIAELRERLAAKKNQNTKVANKIKQSISRLERLKASVESDFAKRISDLEARVERMKDPKYNKAMYKQAKMQEHAKWAENLIGDTSTWADKKLGIQYEVNTERRNLRDIIRDENGNKDIARADAIDDALGGQYNREEANKKRELAQIREKYAKLKITKAEDAYIQMLGEFRGNPDTTLTEKVVNEYYENHKDKIDTAKVEKVLELARQDYDYLLNKANAALREQGMKEIPYRQGYFPHFTEPKQNFIQKLLNWKTQDNEIPTSIAGLTEGFRPVKKYQSFDKQRHGDTTDYSFLKGFDNYSEGALDWAYHLDTLQKRRAVENYIRYTHSEEGIKARIKEVYANEEYDADEAQVRIEEILREANNPLNNFVQDFMTKTNILAGKKNSLDRTMEQKTNRKIYSVMTNVQNRMSANMVLANVRSALTNFIPITQSWAQVSPLRSLQATKDTIANAIKDDGVIEKSTFLTNRLREVDNLYKTNWDKVLDKAGIMFEVVDNFSSQVIWRSKYNQNLANGMTEAQAIKNADQFAENVMAGRSKGNEPTLFNAKNPLVKAFTMFQLEVNNQYGYLFKDVPNDLKAETNHWKLKLTKGYTTAFIGAYVYNALMEEISGSGAALDPIGIIEDLLRDLGMFDDDEEKEPDEVVTNLVDNVVEELPFVGGLFGGGRIPISSALPYEDDGLKGFVEDVSEGNWKNIGKEMMNPILNIGLPVGGGQIKKTVQGLKMFNTDEEHPVMGSYTDSGALRFPVEDTLGNRIQAGIFGQYANENAREYFDNGYAPLKEKQIQEYADVDLPIADYWKYREGLSGLKTNAEKADYINSLDIKDWQKNLLMNNILDRKEDVDMSNYDDYSNFEEFDFAQKNPEKYEFFKANGISYSDYANADEDGKEAYSWAYKNPEKYIVSKTIADDVVTYRSYTSDLNDIRADKDAYGDTIVGSAKEKKIEYINSLDLDYGQKIILFKSQYKSDDTYNADIVNYLNNLDYLTYEERITIFTELGFTVQDGYVYWD